MHAPDLLMTSSAQAECARLMSVTKPREACALLLGEKTDRGHEVERVTEVLNLSPKVDAFELDPITWQAVELEARAEGLEVIGVWHSHPRAHAAPSRRDRAGAQPGWSHAITSAAESGRTRSYYSCAGGLVEQRVITLS